MPIPRKLLQTAFETLSEKTLRAVAEHNEIRGRHTATTEELCTKMSRNRTNMLSYTSRFSVQELRAIARVFDIDTKGKRKNDLDSTVWGFIYDYDKIRRKLTYDDVFSNPRSNNFGVKLRDWMDARRNGRKLADLSDGERTLWEIRHATMDINGNSFPGVFEGGDNDRPQKFVQALREIGANRSAKAFEQIGRMLFDGEVPKTRTARCNALVLSDDVKSDAFDSLLEKCHAIWDKSHEDLAALSQKYAAQNPGRFRP